MAAVAVASAEDKASPEDAQSPQKRLFAHCELGQYEEIADLLKGRRGLFVNCVNSRGDTPLHAVRDVRCAELLLESGGNLQGALNRQNQDSETPLMVCLRLGDEVLAGFYLDNGADVRPPNRYFQTCLHVAARAGLVRILDRLLTTRQLDLNQADRTGNCPVHYAVTFADKEKAAAMLDRLLQESQLTVDAEDSLGRTAFILAAQSSNLAACRLLRDHGSDLCHADSKGANALHVSAAVAGREVVRHLVSDLAFSVDQPDRLGRTALFYAVHHAAEETAAELLTLGADPNRTDRLGRTPAHVAAEKGLESCLVGLMAAGADLHLADTAGRTPLHLAAANGRRETVKRLLRIGGGGSGVEEFRDARDAEGKTAHDLALEGRHKQVADLLTATAAAPATGSAGTRGSYPRPKSAAASASAATTSAARAKAEAVQPAEDAQRVRRTAQEQEETLARQERAKRQAEAEAETDAAQQMKEKPEAKLTVHDENQKQEPAAEPSGDSEVKVAPESSPASDDPNAAESAATSSASSMKRVADLEDNAKDEEAAGDNEDDDSSESSRPSSHLEEELHGDRRTREAEDVRDDPYLTAEPAWITGVPTAKVQQQPRWQPQRLRRGKKVAPNIAALRQRLYMYDSTVMLARVLNEERRERMLIRGAPHHFRQKPLPPQPPQRATSPRRRRRPMRPSTAVDAERLSDRYRDISRETRELLDKWRSDHGGDDDGRRSATPRPRDSSSDRATPRRQQPAPPPPPPYRRPQSGSRFLDYFPNNQPGEQAGGGQGRGRRSRSAKKSAGSSKKPPVGVND